MFKESNKTFDIFPGRAEFEVTAVDTEKGEMSGVFVSKQPSDTDMGSKVPKTVLSKGVWFANINDPKKA